MFCPKCGAELEDGAKFCSSCGAATAVENAQEIPEATIPEPETTVYTESTPANSYTYTIPENPNQQVFNATVTENKSGGGTAIASLILGIASFLCCGFVTAIPGLICGILGLKSDKRGMAIAGIITSAINIVLTVISIVFFVALLSNPEFMEEFSEAAYYYY